MKICKTSELTWKPLFIDGDDESGWVIVYQNSVTQEMRESNEVFDNEIDAQECFDNGGVMPDAFNKMIDSSFGKATQYH